MQIPLWRTHGLLPEQPDELPGKPGGIIEGRAIRSIHVRATHLCRSRLRETMQPPMEQLVLDAPVNDLLHDGQRSL
jgi:hypothetical protein